MSATKGNPDLPPAPGALDRPLSTAGIAGLSGAVATRMAKGLGLRTVRDLLEHVPRRYIDLSTTKKIRDLKIGEEATTQGTVVRVDGRYVRSKRHLLTVTIKDDTGSLALVWWNQAFRTKSFAQGQRLVVAGRLERTRSQVAFTNPFYEPLKGSGDQVHTGRVIPIHSTTQGVSTTQIRRFVHTALQRYGTYIGDPLPSGLVREHSLMARADAIRELHFPTTDKAMRAARHRLVFEELFVLSSGLAIRKRRLEHASDGIAHPDASDVDSFLLSLPFDPTRAQRRVIDEIAADMARARPMNRLLQGEVGSGKTVVAVAAALIAHASGSQTAFMAPTEVLAEQHFATVKRLLEPLSDRAPVESGKLFGDGFEVVLLTGSVTGKDRKRALEKAASGEAMMLVGTHALIQEGVEFDRLGLAIVDEQHRFGVHQRIALRAKGIGGGQPDTLIMTATPIPRTLTLTLYGDLDVSALDEMPPGRMPVATTVARDEFSRARAYKMIRSEAERGRQAFIICPLVEDSASLEVKAAESEYERIRSEVFPDLRVGLIHGRLRSQEKENAMKQMRDGLLDVLVATTVIEVGVDVPNATVMIVEDADRFGLSQLHQLRGRVGRGSEPANCFLFTAIDPLAEEARADAMTRLNAMASTNDGLKLAELDLELRGGGQLFGRGALDEGKGAPAQVGRGDLRFANLTRDLDVLVEARRKAFDLVDRDPGLSSEGNRPLLDEVRRRFADRLDWLFAS
ncbi:MAG TPA: ATP-dependent DNA helicase RecG [Actinomycetota bacterium]|nr:ATP-dependent DNA helicase RecG [Actinomycetota bacterium]